MPYYRITITDIDGKIWQGVREDALTNIDQYYQKVHRKALLSLKNRLRTVDVVMLTCNSPQVQDYVKRKVQSKMPGSHIIRQ